jgi:hypothetical protein
MRPALGFALPFSLLVLGGCPNREISEIDPNQDKVEQKEIPLTINRDIDILFVIDNSRSMREEQDQLRANFPEFINVLNQIEGGLPNVHLGVVSSDMGTLNVNTGDSACGGLGDQGNLVKGTVTTPTNCNVNGLYISDVLDPSPPGTNRIQNYTGSLADAFSCTAALGDGGCGFEQHLEAMKAALSPSDGMGGSTNTVNSGFIRRNAYLAVVFLADEDDCSASNPQFFGAESPALGPLDSFRCFEKGINCNEGTDTALRDVGVKTGCVPNESSTYMHHIQEYVDFLRAYKPDPRDVIVAGIIGLPVDNVEVGRRIPMGQTMERPDLLPSCSYTDAQTGMTSVADPGIRLQAFLDGFPDRNTSTTICNDVLSDGLQQIAELLRTVIGFPCIEGQPAMPLQVSCAYVTRPGEPDEVETVLPQCDATASNNNPGCWRVITDSMNCDPATTSGLAIEIVRAMEPPPDTVVKCDIVSS